MAAHDIDTLSPPLPDSSPASEDKEILLPAHDNDPKDHSPVTAPIEPSLPSFKEESYFISDLKDSEKKALHDFKLRIQDACKSGEFNASPSPVVTQTPPVPEVVAEVELAKVIEAKAAETKSEAKMEDVWVNVEQTEDVAPESVTATEKSEVASVKTDDLKTSSDLVEEKEPPIKDIFLWGVPILPSKEDERTDVILLKFLRARDFKVNEAFNMLKNTVLWRRSFHADKLLEEDLGNTLDGVAYMHGLDKEGHPVCYNAYGVFQDADLYQNTFGDDEKIKKFLRWRVQLLERGIGQLDFTAKGASAMVQITDFKNAPGPGKKELKAASNQALNLLQDNYPELVVKKVFINVPWYFGAIYSVFSPFLTQRTRSKFVVASSGKVTEALFKFISPDQIPVQYGGFSRADDSEFNDVEKPQCTELVIKSAEKTIIDIPVAEAGVTVIWDLIVIGWHIAYGVEFVPSAEGGYTTIIERTQKITTSELPIRNSFKASQVGKIVLTIDNAASRKKKIGAYRYGVKKST